MLREVPADMSEFSNPYVGVVVGALLILIGISIAMWSLRLWQRPTSLREGSRLYRYLLTDWQTWPRKRSNIGKLTNKRIKYYAVRGFLAGGLLVIVGILLMLK